MSNRDVWRTGEIVPDAELWARFMGYPSAGAWAHAGQYLHDVDIIRGNVRPHGGRVLFPVNFIVGEIG